MSALYDAELADVLEAETYRRASRESADPLPPDEGLSVLQRSRRRRLDEVCMSFSLTVADKDEARGLGASLRQCMPEESFGGDAEELAAHAEHIARVVIAARLRPRVPWPASEQSRASDKWCYRCRDHLPHRRDQCSGCAEDHTRFPG